jgi:2-polyprenyl-6-methoxyphenol hydroxylase-like FAD-dependent oxidoreductase
VAQFRQPHIMLPRWRHLMEREIPEALERLAELGGARVNMLHLYPESVTGGRQPGDERFDTLTGRRPVVEAALAAAAVATDGVTIRRGVALRGLLVERGPVPAVVGVRTATGDLRADLVVDAAGRRTPGPGWAVAAGLPAPAEQREDAGLVYYTRHYRARDGRLPRARAGALTHHESFSVLILPADNGTWGIALVTSARDRALRRLREPDAWEAAARALPEVTPWIDAEPLTEVRPIAGIQDVTHSYVVGDRPVAAGLVNVGDAATATDPALGRGATIGALHACVLRDAVTAAPDVGSPAFAGHYARLTAERIAPLVAMTLGAARHRLGEMNAEVAGEAYRPADETWPRTLALMAGAREDPVLLRAFSLIMALLATPPEVMSDPGLQRRVGPYAGASRYPAGDVDRAALLRAIGAPPPRPRPALPTPSAANRYCRRVVAQQHDPAGRHAPRDPHPPDHGRPNPASRARTMASERWDSCSFTRIVDTLLATVFADRYSFWPIWALVSPAATPSRISRSRSVSCGNGSSSRRPGPAANQVPSRRASAAPNTACPAAAARTAVTMSAPSEPFSR